MNATTTATTTNELITMRQAYQSQAKQSDLSNDEFEYVQVRLAEINQELDAILYPDATMLSTSDLQAINRIIGDSLDSCTMEYACVLLQARKAVRKELYTRSFAFAR